MKIVLLPGLDGTGRLFESFIESMPQGMVPTVCVYPDDPHMQFQNYLKFVSEFCPNSEPYLLLGESFSGPIAIEIAATNPTMLRGIILVNTFLACPGYLTLRLLRLVPTQLLTKPPSVLLTFLLRQRENGIEPHEQIGSVLRSLSGRLIRSRLSILVSVDVQDAAAKINVPVCLIQSADDMAVPENARSELIDSLQDPEVHFLKGNHFGLQTYPIQAARIVSEFHDKFSIKSVEES